MVFSIGVLMLLLRPYVVYRLTGYGNTDKNPVKSALLQRMIKKKDDHYECLENAAVEVRSSKFSFLLLVKRILSFHCRSTLPISANYLRAFAAMVSSMFLLRQRYRQCSLLSCFRI